MTKFDLCQRLIAIALLGLAAPKLCIATIQSNNQLSIDLADPDDAGSKAEWFPPDKLSVDKQGLGWDGKSHALVDGWIQTKPLALGTSWRPTTIVSVRLAIEPAPAQITLPNGQQFTSYPGNVFIRYSPDRKHWSSWQSLQPRARAGDSSASATGRHFHASLQVPSRERIEYTRLLDEYGQLDVPWKSDEDAAVRWIVARDPEFFSGELPFMGYVEFLFEQGFYGGQRIKSIKADLGWAVSGMHVPPRDNQAGATDGPWKFVADEKPAAEQENRSAEKPAQ